MKTLLKSFAVLGALTLPSHAIFGIGGHWAPALGLEVKGDSGSINQNANIRLDEQGTSGLKGFGVKLWIDAFPLVDIQLSGNVQFSTYGANVIVPTGSGDTTVPLEFNLGPLFPKAKPPFGRIFGDIAVLYPFLKFPPMVSLIKLYGGGGLTYGVATEVMNSKFAKSAMDKAVAGGFNPATATPTAVAQVLADDITNAGLKSGMGGFLQLGAQAKPPVIPIAVYLDFKYHFLSFNPDAVSGGLTMELGGALAF